jgi:uncharacterized protein (TIGR00266 family)
MIVFMQADIKGTTLPVLEITLQSGEEVVTIHGELSWMTPNVQLSQTTGGGSAGGGGGFMGGLKRMIGGGSLFLTRYQAQGGAGMVAFAAKLPGHIMPVDIAPGQAFMVHRHGWLCGTPGVTAGSGFQQSFRGGLYGGDGFILQKLEGEGRAWIELAGELIHYTLQPGQTLMVHPGHIGMFEASVQFQVTRMPGIMNMAFGDDGFHLVALTGPGQVWLQSMPLPILAHALQPYLTTQSAAGPVEGGVVGGIIGNIMRGQ